MASQGFHSLHANVYDRKDSYILDNSCGTGLVSAYIKSQFPFAKIKGADIAPGVIETYKTRIIEGKWKGCDAEVLDCRDLKTLKDNTFTHVITNFGFAPNPDDPTGQQRAVKEMYRVLKPGGVAVVTTWAKRNFGDVLENASRVIRPNEESYSWKSLSDWDKGWWVMKHFEDNGFGHQVEVRSVKGSVSAESLEEMVSRWMLFKDMWWKNYTEEEVKRLPGVLTEEAKKFEWLEVEDGGVKIETAAWITVARK